VAAISFEFSLFIYLCCMRLQLICTVTPSSSSSEETHNTLKFAHRAKHIEIQAAQNKAYSSFYSFELSVLFKVSYLALIGGNF
jgi:hypothetical protein